MPFFHQRLKRLGGREVDLVDDHQRGQAAAADALHDLGRAVALLHGVGDVEDHVGVAHGARDELHHRLLEFVVGLQNPRRVGVYDLEVVARDDAHDSVARGLRLGGDDRETLAHQGVHERRFADIGVADDVYETAFVHAVQFCLQR